MRTHPSIHQTATEENKLATSQRQLIAAEMASSLLWRADPLPASDKELLHAFYAQGKTAVALAKLLGTNPRIIRRRIERLTALLRSPAYLFVLRNRHRWPPTLASVATHIHLQGHSIRATAAALGVPYHLTRLHEEALQAMLAAHLVAMRQEATAADDIAAPPHHEHPHVRTRPFSKGAA